MDYKKSTFVFVTSLTCFSGGMVFSEETISNEPVEQLATISESEKAISNEPVEQFATISEEDNIQVKQEQSDPSTVQTEETQKYPVTRKSLSIPQEQTAATLENETTTLIEQDNELTQQQQASTITDIKVEEKILVEQEQTLADLAQPSEAPSEQSKPTEQMETSCGPLPIGSQRIEMRHIESKGVGYKQGYTTLEGFFVPSSCLEGSWVPFLDLRGHFFNDSRLAANAGLGLRYLTSMVWGINAYYDYRSTKKYHYNQVGAGLEMLGKLIDLRINGYLPVGGKTSPYFQTDVKGFEGNHLILKRKSEFAMKGGNAEIGFHFAKSGRFQMYSAAGPYYFQGKGKTAWGGEGRIAVDLYDYVRVQVNGSYDTVFKGILQGELSLMIPFGKKKEIKRRNSYTCPQELVVKERALQRIDRNEIVVVDRKRSTTPAINPVTGDPYFFVFVDNTSHSKGTFESPYNTLLAAQNGSNPNDIIYVFPGDGTDTGMRTGITLQSGQQLLGAGISHSFDTPQGVFNVDPLATSNPTISDAGLSNVPFGAAVTLAYGNNVVSGFSIVDVGVSFTNNGSGIAVLNGANYLIENNTISTSNDSNGIYINNNIGNGIVIKNNTIIALDNTDAFGIWITHGSGGVFDYQQANPTIKNNLFTSINPTSSFSVGIAVNAPSSGTLTFSILNNTLQLPTSLFFAGSSGISITSESFSFGNINATLIENNLYVPDSNAVAGVNVGVSGHGVCSINLQRNNSITDIADGVPGYLFHNFTGNPSQLQVDFGVTNIGTVSFLP